MKKVFLKIKPFIKYFLVFFFFLFWNLIVQPINLDEIWNYGFIHNIYSGLIPYKDFNMVLTPLYPFIMSCFFLIFGSNMLVLHIVNSLMITGMLYLIEKLIKKDIGIFVLLLCFPLSVAFPSYNLFLLLMFIVVIYLEKNNYNDYLIGFVLGLFILSKQTVGVCLCLPTIYYLFKDYKKVIKRVIGCLVPCIIFLIYLLCTGSLINFLDLCLFGLFDFAESNSSSFNIMLVISILLMGLNIYLIIKNKSNLFYYYLLSFFSILVPLFDLYHLELYVLAFLLIWLLESNKEIKIKFLNINLFIYGVLAGVIVLTLSTRFTDKIYFPNNINHFEYRAVNKKYLDYTESVNSKVLEYNNDGKEIIFLSADGYYFRLINDMKISYIDLINSGNWGYNGSEKLLSYVKEHSDAIIFLDESEIGTNKQTDQNVLKYVVKNGTIIDEVGKYKIYTLGSDNDGEN